MIIDSHTHVDRVGWYDPPETIIGLMDEAGIEKSIIMTYRDAPDSEGALEYIAEAVQKYPDRLIGYARMNPRRGELSHRLFEKAMEEYGFKGLKLHPVGNLSHPASPEATIILGHCGGYFHTKDALRVAERYPNIVLETSAMPYPRVIKEAVERVGASRVLYASDGPGCDPTIEVHKVRMAGLTEEAEAALFYRNITSILDNVTTGRE
jgi:predicted TIM-barrel fold metal-dependent hydrolase